MCLLIQAHLISSLVWSLNKFVTACAAAWILHPTNTGSDTSYLLMLFCFLHCANKKNSEMSFSSFLKVKFDFTGSTLCAHCSFTMKDVQKPLTLFVAAYPSFLRYAVSLQIKCGHVHLWVIQWGGVINGRAAWGIWLNTLNCWVSSRIY